MDIGGGRIVGRGRNGSSIKGIKHKATPHLSIGRNVRKEWLVLGKVGYGDIICGRGTIYVGALENCGSFSSGGVVGTFD